MGHAAASIVSSSRDASKARAKPFRDAAGASGTYIATWDDAAQAVRFAIGPAGTVPVAIERAALAMLASRKTLAAAECLREFRRHRSWIEALAAVTHAERGDGAAIVLTPADVRFELACEAADPLPDVLCI
jgi:hypothetical protein